MRLTPNSKCNLQNTNVNNQEETIQQFALQKIGNQIATGLYYRKNNSVPKQFLKTDGHIVSQPIELNELNEFPLEK